VDGFLTAGHPAAVAAVHAMLGSRVPHAMLISGPASVGKVTLALDLAAGLLCTGATGADRPCRACRTCRLVVHGNHPDLHRLAPIGPGFQIRIGEDLHPEPGTIRRLAVDLALMPVEGGARVAIIRDAQRMSDVAQSALLKTLEEPPAGTTVILCADDEELLLPTIRSRCARIRLGIVGVRDVERLLTDRGLADPPTAARLARLTGGRPGLAVAYASADGVELIRGELTRTLLDLLGQGPARRLAAAKPLLARAMELDVLLAPVVTQIEEAPRRSARGATPEQAPAIDGGDGSEEVPHEAAEEGPVRKTPAAARRRALLLLLDAWRALARDLACAQRGAPGSIRDIALLEEIEAAARDLPADAAAGILTRLVRADELVAGNVSPELVLDVLLVRWPRRRHAP